MAKRLQSPEADSAPLPPHAAGDEMAVLGGCLLDPSQCAPRAIEILGPTTDAFHLVPNREVWGAVVSITESGEKSEPMQVIQWLRERKSDVPPEFTAGLPDAISSPANLDHHLEKVLEMWRRRRIIAACLAAIEAAVDYADPDGYLDRIAAEVAALDRKEGDEAARPSAFLHRYIDALEARHALQGALPGIATGFYSLDAKEGGLRLREMLVVGARPYEGKTALACNIVERACFMDGIATLFISLEMTREKLMDRFTALCGVDIDKLSSGKLTPMDFQRITVNNSKIKKSPLFIVEQTGGMTSTEATSCIRRYSRQHGVKLVILDYLQKLTPVGRHEKTTYGLGDTCKRLRHCAVSAGLSLVALAQLNRDIDKGKSPRPPRMSDLADSKAIEAEADTVILLSRDNDRERTLFVPKSRNSGGCIVNLSFDPETLKFSSRI